MPLVTSTDVRKIFPTEVDCGPFIKTADTIVQEELQGRGLSNDRLTQIELYLSAHFACVALERGGLTRQRVGESEDFYQSWNNNEIGFNATRYGQQACSLDTTGRLQIIGASKKLSARFGIVSRTNGRYGTIGTYDDGESCP